MKSATIFLALAMMVAVAESTIFVIGGGAAVAGGGFALAGLLGLKAAFLGGALIGAAASRRRTRTHFRPSRKSFSRSFKSHGHGRFGRSIEDEKTIDNDEALSNAILDASLNDADDCAKKLICSLNAKEVSTLASDESAIAELFGKSGSIDVTAATAEFDLAALMGRLAGKAQCDTIYARCPYESKDLMETMRSEF